MAVGAYSSVFLTVYYSQSASSGDGLVGATVAQSLVFLLVIIVGALVAALAGLLVGIPSLRLRGDYLAIVTLGFAEIIRIIILNIDRVGGATGFRGACRAMGRPSDHSAVCKLHLDRRLCDHHDRRRLQHRPFRHRTRVDLDSRRRAGCGSMGINTTRYKVLAFVISSAFAGIAGALFGHFRQFLHTNDFQFIRSIEIIIMIVLGGMGSITGAVLGAIVITILPELLRQLPGNLIHYRLVIYSALLVVIMLTRPQGVMGAKEFGIPG